MYRVGGNLFLKLKHGATDHSRVNGAPSIGKRTRIQFHVYTFCKDVLMFLALYRVFKSMEPLSFDSPADTEAVKRSSTSPKVFESIQGGEKKKKKNIYIYIYLCVCVCVE